MEVAKLHRESARQLEVFEDAVVREDEIMM